MMSQVANMFIVKYVLLFLNVFSPGQTVSSIFHIHPDRLNSKLQGYIYLKFEKIPPRLCFNKCIRRPNCHSYNYNKALLTCELNNKPKSVSTEDFYFQNGYVYVEIDQYRGDPLLDPCHRKPCQSAEICEIKPDGNTFCVKDNKYTIKESTTTTKVVKTSTNHHTNIPNTGTSATQISQTNTNVTTRTAASFKAATVTTPKNIEFTTISSTIENIAEIPLTTTKGTIVSKTHGPKSYNTTRTPGTILQETTAYKSSVSPITYDQPMELTDTIASSMAPTKTLTSLSDTVRDATTDKAPITSAKTIELTSVYNTSGTTADIQLTNTEGASVSETQGQTFEETTHIATSSLLETTAAHASSSPSTHDKPKEMTDTIASSATQTKTLPFSSESQMIGFTTDDSNLTGAINDKDNSTVTAADTITLASKSTTVVNNTNTVGTSTEKLLINTKGTTVFETHGSTSDEATHTSSSTLQKTTTQASNSPISNDNQSKTIARTTNSGSTSPFISDTQTIGTRTNDTTVTDAITDEDTVTIVETNKLTSLSSNTVTTTKTVGTTADTPLTNKERIFTVSKTNKSPSDETTHTATANLLETAADQFSVSQITNNKSTETTETMARPETPTKTSTSISDSQAIGFTTDDTTATETTTSETTVTDAKSIELTYSSNIVGPTNTTVGTTAENRLIDTDGTTTVSETHGSPSDNTAQTSAILLMETTADQASSSPITYDEPREISNIITNSTTPTKTQATISESQKIDFTTDDSNLTDTIPHEDAVTAAETTKSTSISNTVVTTTNTVDTSVTKPLNNTKGTTVFETHGSKSDETTRTSTSTLIKTTARQTSNSLPTYTKLGVTTETMVGSKAQTKTPAFIPNTKTIGSRTVDTTISEVSVTAAKTIKLLSITNTIGTTEETPLINTEGMTTVSETRDLGSDAITHTAVTTLLETTTEQALVSPTTNNKPREMTDTIASTAMPTKTISETQGPTFDKTTHTAAITLQKTTQASNAPITNENQTKTIASTANPGSIPPFISDTQTIGTRTNDTTVTDAITDENTVTTAKLMPIIIGTSTKTIGTTAENQFIKTKNTSIVSQNHGRPTDETTHTAATNLPETTTDQSSVSSFTNYKWTKTTNPIARPDTLINTSAFISNTQMIGFTTDDNTATATTISEATDTDAYAIQRTSMFNTAGTTTKIVGSITDKHLTNTEGVATISETNEPTSDEITYTAAKSLVTITVDRASDSPNPNENPMETTETIGSSTTPTKTSKSMYDTQTNDFKTDDTMMKNTSISDASDTNANTIHLTSMSNTAGITTMTTGTTTDKHLISTKDTTTVSETHEPRSDETFFTAATTLVTITADQSSVPPIANDKQTKTTETVASWETPTQTSQSIYDTQTIGFTTDDSTSTDTTTSEATVLAAKTIKSTLIYNTAGITKRTIGTITDKHLTNTEDTTTVSETRGLTSDETTYTAATTLLKTTADPASVTSIVNDKPTKTTETIASAETPTQTSQSIYDTQTIGFTIDDTTVTDTTTSEATVLAAKTIKSTLIYNTAGITKRTIGTITDKHLTNTEDTTTVSETRGLTSDETTYTAPTTLLQTTAAPASVTSIVNDKMTEKMKTIANSETQTKTSTSISDTQTVGFTTDDITMTNTTTIEATDTAAKNIQLTSMSSTVGITTKLVGNIPDKHLTNTEGTTTVSQPQVPPSDETTHTAATTLLKTTADQTADPSITNDKPTETTYSIDSLETPTKTSTSIFDSQTIGLATDAPMMTDKTIIEATDTDSNIIQLTSMSNTADITSSTIGTTTDQHLTNTEGTTIVSETHEPPSDETTHTAATILLETSAGQSSVTLITNYKPTETMEVIGSYETPIITFTSMFDTQTIGFTIDDTTVTDTTTSEATVTAAKTIESTLIYNTAGITTRTIGTITDKHLTNTEGTTTVSETRGLTSDETTYTAPTTLLQTNTDPASVTSIVNDKMTEKMKTIAYSETPAKTSQSIYDTQTIGFTTDGITMTNTTTIEATDTAAKNIQLTSMSNTVGSTTKRVGNIPDKHLTNTEGTTTVSQPQGPPSDVTTHTAATTLLKTTAAPASVTSIVNDKMTEKMKTIANSETPTKTSTSISDTQTIGFTTDDIAMTNTTTIEATDTAAKNIQLTSMSSTVGSTTKLVGNIPDKHLTNTEGTTTVSQSQGPPSDETTHTTATTLTKTTADQTAASSINNDKPTETTFSIDTSSSETPTKTSTSIFDSQTIGFTTDDTMMTDKIFIEATDTDSNIIQLTSMSNTADITSSTIGTTTDQHLTNTEGTTIVSETHEPPSDDTTHTAATILLETPAGQSSVTPITNYKPTETMEATSSSETPTITFKSMFDTQTIGFTTDDTTMTVTTTSEATETAAKPIELTSMSNTAGITTRTIGTTTNHHLKNTEGTTTVSATHKPTSDKTTHTAATILLKTTAHQDAVSPSSNDIPTETTETIAFSKTSTSISDTQTNGFSIDDYMMTDITTSEAIVTAAKTTIQLTSMSNTAGVTNKIVGTTTNKHLTNTEGTTTVSQPHGPPSDETTHTAATTLLKTTADQSADPSITNYKPTETTFSIDTSSSETPTKTSTSIFDSQTIGLATDAPMMTDKTIIEATDTDSNIIQLTSMSNTADITSSTIGTTTDQHLTNTEGTIVSKTHEPTSDETTHTVATILLETPAGQSSVTPNTNYKQTETMENTASSETPTITFKSMFDIQTIGFTTDVTTMTVTKTSETTVTAPKTTIQITSMSNTADTINKIVGTTTNKHLTNTEGTTTDFQSHGPTSDETTHTTATTLIKTNANQSADPSITNDKQTETTDSINRSETPTKKSTPISNTQTIGITTDDPMMTDTTSEATVTAAKTNELTSISNTASITTRTIGATTDKHLTSTKGTAIVSETYKPTSDETTYTAATTLLKTTADSALVTSITNDKLTELTDSIDRSETSTKKSTPVSDIQTIVFTTDDPTMSDKTSEATVTAAKTIELTSISNTAGITTRTIGATTDKHLTSKKGTTIVSETYKQTSEETTYTAATTLPKTTADSALITSITNDKLTETTDSIDRSETSTKKSTPISDIQTIVLTTADPTMSDTTSEATVTAAKNIDFTKISNTVDITTNTVDTTEGESLINTEGTTIVVETYELTSEKTAFTTATSLVETTVDQAADSLILSNKPMETSARSIELSHDTNNKNIDKSADISSTNTGTTSFFETHEPPSDKTTNTSIETLVEKIADQASVSPITINKQMETTDTIASSATPTKTLTSITETNGFTTDYTTVTDATINEATVTSTKKLTYVYTNPGTTTYNIDDKTANIQLTNNEGTTVSKTHGATADESTHKATTTLLETTAIQTSNSPFNYDKPTELTDTVASSATLTITSASISDFQTIGTRTYDTTVTKQATDEVPFTASENIELTSTSAQIGTTINTVVTTAENSLTSTEGTTTIYETHGPTIDETTITTAYQASIIPITDNGPTETTDTIAISATPSKTPAFISETQTVGLTTDDATVTDATTSEATITVAKTIELTSKLNYTSTSTKTIGISSEQSLINTEDTTVFETHRPTSDETNHTAATTL